MNRTHRPSRRSSSSSSMPIFEPLPSRVMMSATLPSAAVAHPNYVLAPHASADVAAPIGTTPTGLLASQVRHAFGVDSIRFGNVVGDGSGQTIAIVDAFHDPKALTDLHTFDAAMGLPNPPSFSQIDQNGGTHLPGTDPTGSWETEESLDIQWAHAVAPKAKIVLVEANSDGVDLGIAVNTARNLAGVSIVSMSFGSSENIFEGVASGLLYNTPLGHSGVTFLASSGDSGAFNGPNNTLGVSFPAASPNVLAVGGTTFNTNAAGAYLGETAWSGSGGGISQNSMPDYQKGTVTGTNNKRGVPDVAWLADPSTGVSVVDSFNNGSTAPWMTVGGTSLSTPMWAGLLSIVNQGRTLAGKSVLDGASQTLPKLYQLPSSDFHDITTGGNGHFNAHAGYDLVTGRGSPKADKVVADLVGGSISGRVFTRDVFGNKVGMPAWTVYIDKNNNGKLDAGEISTLTDISGNYKFGDVLLGSFRIRQISGLGFTPGNGASHVVTLTSTAPKASGIDFDMLFNPFAG